MDRLQVALNKLGRTDQAVAVLFFDLDHFKTVNDSLGHKWGDRLLRTVAIRLEGVVRPGDTVARLGGDEFAMLCEGISGPDDAMNIGRRMVAATAEPVSDESHTVEVTASVGIALARGPGRRPRCTDPRRGRRDVPSQGPGPQPGGAVRR